MAQDLAVSVRIGAVVGAAYRSAFTDATGRLRKLGDTFKKTDRQLAAAGGLIKHKQKLDEVRAHHAKVGASADKMLADAKSAYAGAVKSAEKYGITVGNVVDRQKKLQTELKRTEARIEAQQRRMARRDRAGGFLRAGRARMLGVAGAGYAVSRMVGGAMEREEQRDYLRTVLTGPDRDAMVGRAMDRAREFSRTSLASDEEIINIQYALHSAGFDESAVDAAEERVHRLAKVTRGEAGQVGEVFATTFNNLGRGMAGTVEQKMDRIGNVLAKTQFMFQIRDFGQLGEGFKEAAGEAVAAKLSIEDTAAAVGLLNTRGLQGGRAGTALSQMLRNMHKAADEFGFEIAYDEKGSLQLLETLKNFREAADIDDVYFGAQLNEAVGSESGAAFKLLLPVLDELVAKQRELKEAATSDLVNQEYGRFLQGGAGQLKMLGQNARQVGEIFANTLLPQITKTVGWLAGMAGWASELIERFPWVGRLVGALAFGFGLLTVGAMGLAGAVWVVNAAMLANPIGLVAAGFVAAGAIIYALWDPIKEKVGALWEKIKGLWDLIKGVGDAIRNSPIGKWVRRQFGDDEADDEADDSDDAASAPPRAPRRPRRGRVGRVAAAGLVAAPLAAAATPAPVVVTPAPEPPQVVVAAPPAPVPQVGDAATPAPIVVTPAPEPPQVVVAAPPAPVPQVGDAATPAPIVVTPAPEPPQVVVAAPPAPVPQVGDAATPEGPAPDYAAMQEEAARIGAAHERARAGAATPPEHTAGVDLEALRGDVQALTESVDVSGALPRPAPIADDERASPPDRGAQGGVQPGQPGTAPAASVVFHTTIYVQGAGAEGEEEIKRNFERMMRQAAQEARLAEADDPY